MQETQYGYIGREEIGSADLPRVRSPLRLLPDGNFWAAPQGAASVRAGGQWLIQDVGSTEATSGASGSAIRDARTQEAALRAMVSKRAK